MKIKASQKIKKKSKNGNMTLQFTPYQLEDEDHIIKEIFNNNSNNNNKNNNKNNSNMNKTLVVSVNVSKTLSLAHCMLSIVLIYLRVILSHKSVQ